MIVQPLPILWRIFWVIPRIFKRCSFLMRVCCFCLKWSDGFLRHSTGFEDDQPVHMVIEFIQRLFVLNGNTAQPANAWTPRASFVCYRWNRNTDIFKSNVKSIVVILSHIWYHLSCFLMYLDFRSLPIWLLRIDVSCRGNRLPVNLSMQVDLESASGEMVAFKKCKNEVRVRFSASAHFCNWSTTRDRNIATLLT